jgi:hypothetical protein
MIRVELSQSPAILPDVLKIWKKTTQFSAPEDWMFASPIQIDRPPWSYTGVKEELQRAADASDIRTSMNIYGDAVTTDMREASGNVAALALNGRQNGW